MRSNGCGRRSQNATFVAGIATRKSPTPAWGPDVGRDRRARPGRIGGRFPACSTVRRVALSRWLPTTTVPHDSRPACSTATWVRTIRPRSAASRTTPPRRSSPACEPTPTPRSWAASCATPTSTASTRSRSCGRTPPPRACPARSGACTCCAHSSSRIRTASASPTSGAPRSRTRSTRSSPAHRSPRARPRCTELADRILRGLFEGDFAVALDRAAAFSRVVAAGFASLADDEDAADAAHPDRPVSSPSAPCASRSSPTSSRRARASGGATRSTELGRRPRE